MPKCYKCGKVKSSAEMRKSHTYEATPWNPLKENKVFRFSCRSHKRVNREISKKYPALGEHGSIEKHGRIGLKNKKCDECMETATHFIDIQESYYRGEDTVLSKCLSHYGIALAIWNTKKYAFKIE